MHEEEVEQLANPWRLAWVGLSLCYQASGVSPAFSTTNDFFRDNDPVEPTAGSGAQLA